MELIKNKNNPYKTISEAMNEALSLIEDNKDFKKAKK